MMSEEGSSSLVVMKTQDVVAGVVRALLSACTDA
jgi:hypothetical protein